MSTLDNPNEGIRPESVSPWPTGTRYGLLAGLVLIVLGLLIHLTGMVDYTGQDSSSNWLTNLINWGVIAAAIVLAVKQHRDTELGGHITFGRSFFVGFIVTLLAAVVSMVWGYVFFSFVEPSLIESMLEMSRDQMMEQQGLSGSEVDNAMGMISWMFTPIMLSLMGGLALLVVGIIFSLIIAAIMKREVKV